MAYRFLNTCCLLAAAVGKDTDTDMQWLTKKSFRNSKTVMKAAMALSKAKGRGGLVMLENVKEIVILITSVTPELRRIPFVTERNRVGTMRTHIIRHPRRTL